MQSRFGAIARVLYSGFTISLLGCLPMGILNITAFQLSANGNITGAFYFVLGVILAEIIYVFLLYKGINKIMQNIVVQKLLQAIAFCVIVLLIITTAKALYYNKPIANSVFLEASTNIFITGFFMSAINPFQFPFWATWLAVLHKKKVFTNEIRNEILFPLSAGVGTFLGNSLFILIGIFFKNHLVRFNVGVTIICLVFYIISLYYFLKSKKMKKQ